MVAYHFVGSSLAVREVKGQDVRAHPREDVFHYPLQDVQLSLNLPLFFITITMATARE